MSDGNELRDALRVAVPVEPEDKVARRREALVSVLEREIALTPHRVEKEQSRLKWRHGVRVLSVAAALVATLGLGMLVSELGTEDVEGRTTAAKAPHSLEQTSVPVESEDRESLAGRAFETRAGHQKALQLGGGTKVILSAHTKMLIERDTANEQHVRLNSGAVSLSVPPHRTNRSVEVKTKHATVHVTGTVFGVEVGRFPHDSEAPPRTRVTVERGEVVVRHESGTVTLEPGDIWLSPLQLGAIADGAQRSGGLHGGGLHSGGLHSGALHNSASSAVKDPVAAPGRTPPSASSVASRSTEATSPPSTARSTSTTSADPTDGTPAGLRPDAPSRTDAASEATSTLAAENDLLERALSAEKRGQKERAHQLIDRFLERYPRSPLRASVLAVRKRLNDVN